MKDNLDYKIISFLIRGNRRKKVLASLHKPRMPKEIATICSLNISNVSVALSELAKRDLIKCITPNDRMFKFYEITKKGQIAITHLTKYNGKK